MVPHVLQTRHKDFGATRSKVCPTRERGLRDGAQRWVYPWKACALRPGGVVRQQFYAVGGWAGTYQVWREMLEAKLTRSQPADEVLPSRLRAAGQRRAGALSWPGAMGVDSTCASCQQCDGGLRAEAQRTPGMRGGVNGWLGMREGWVVDLLQGGGGRSLLRMACPSSRVAPSSFEFIRKYAPGGANFNAR